MSAPTVDTHGHLVPQSLLELLRSGSHGIESITVQSAGSTSERLIFGVDSSNRPFEIRPLPPLLSDIEERLAWMDSQSIDVQYVSVWGEMHGYHLEASESAAWCRLINESLSETLATEDRLRPYAAIPLGSPDLAAAEVRWATGADFVGVMCGVHGGATVLGDTTVDPLWEAASDTGMVVYLHPDYPHWNERVGAVEVANSVGRLVDTSTALSNLATSGVFHRFPALKVIAAHGGGGFPFLWPRLRHGLALAQSPYLANAIPDGLSFDTVVHDPSILSYLIREVGTDRVVLGSDYPLANRDNVPVDTVHRAIDDAEARSAILADNAARIFARG